MRTLITILIVLFILPQAKAQMNLVPNPSFEDTVYCPLNLDDIGACISWSSFGNSPDYYNSCAQPGVSVPFTSFGYQHAQTGVAFVGLATFVKYNFNAGPNYREVIGSNLINPLQIGTKYYISFFAVLAESFTGFASNNLGLRFFTTAFSLSNSAPIDNFAHLRFDSILVDSINWTKVTGTFIADSNYQYVSLGNFYDYLTTDSIVISTFNTSAYYFIDDICVSTDSLYNETWTSIQNPEIFKTIIWPNPATEFLQFKSIFPINSVQIIDCTGKLISKVQVNSIEGVVDIKDLAKGIYFSIFEGEKINSVHKFLKF